MSEFIVSARKYRPETFKSVVGQSGITTTLKNAIAGKHLGHAYLFCGPRGVGKTTCARIFAKTINCQNLSPETEPCNQCESCKSFNESRSYNIHELDAASNNTVEDIRLLNEKVRIPPQIGRYSVYIIDEVHMLSLSAFNAFLKTLEEPPAHAVFILATTEKHKIIPTILSRCQIFDFNRIKVPDAVGYLEYIAKTEGIEYEQEALHVIAQKSDGAMRDALSIFDQVVSFSENKISYKSVIDNLNIMDLEYYFRLDEMFITSNVSGVLLLFDEILDRGFDSLQFVSGLASHLRDLLVSLDPQTVPLLELSDNLKQKYLEQSKRFSPDQLFDLIDICTQVELQFRTSRNQRLLIEMALVKMAKLFAEKKKPEPVASLSELPLKEKAGEKPATEIPKTEIKAPALSADSVPVQKPVENPLPSDRSETLKKNLVRTSGISIRDALKPIVKTEEEVSTQAGEEAIQEQEEDAPCADFSEKDLKKEWKAYAEGIREEKPRIYISLTGRDPVLLPDYSVEFLFDNETQIQEFNQGIKHYLLNHLQRQLKNPGIEIRALLREEDNGTKKLYTSEEKFEFLASKNPEIRKLKQQFNLDFN